MVIAPYWYAGTWVFDDKTAGLKMEPVVLNIPDIITELVKDIPAARGGFRLLFSVLSFPGYQAELEWVKEQDAGNWYQLKGQPLEG
jgi:hypothetical protein